jgi:hypothetical protein
MIPLQEKTFVESQPQEGQMAKEEKKEEESKGFM